MKGVSTIKAIKAPAPQQKAVIQPKLMVNEPGDRYEQEADAMADHVMSMPQLPAKPVGSSSLINRSVQRKCAHCEEEKRKHNGGKFIQRQCHACREEESRKRKASGSIMRKIENGNAPAYTNIHSSVSGSYIQRECDHCNEEEKKKKGMLQRKAEGAGGFEASPAMASQLSSSRGAGSPLPERTRGIMENAFSADFSNVRVHTGNAAASMNGDVNAKAFTYGSDIYFNRGQYDPDSYNGRKLLAHELAHVVQQTPILRRKGKRTAKPPAPEAAKPPSIPDYSQYLYTELRTVYNETVKITSVQTDLAAEEELEKIKTELEVRYIDAQEQLYACTEAQNASLSDLFDRRALYEDMFREDTFGIPVQNMDWIVLLKGLGAIQLEVFRQEKVIFKPNVFSNLSFNFNDWTFAGLFEDMSDATYWLNEFANKAEVQELRPLYLSMQEALIEKAGTKLPWEITTTELSKNKEFVESLTDEEVAKYVFILNTYIASPEAINPVPASKFNFNGWDFPDVLANNLRILSFELQEKRLMVPNLNKGLIEDPETADQLATDPAGIRYQLQKMFEQDFLNETKRDVYADYEGVDFRFQSVNLRVTKLKAQLAQGITPVGADPVLISEELDKQFEFIKWEHDQFIDQFAESVRSSVNLIMDQSESTINAEKIRYGLESQEEEYMNVDHAEVLINAESHTVSNDSEVKGMAKAAEELKGKMENVKQAEQSKQSFLEQLFADYNMDQGIPDDPDFVSEFDIEGLYPGILADIEEKKKDLELTKQLVQDNYPALASWTSSYESVSKISNGDNNEIAWIIGRDIVNKLANINKVRREIQPGGDISVWKLAEVIEITEQSMSIASFSIYDIWVRDKIQKVEEDDSWWDTFKTVLAIGLGVLAAIPSGGSSLVAGLSVAATIGSLTLDVYEFSQHLQEYNLQKAMAGTDFDKAKALAHEDPTMLWLALDLVGIVFDAGDAFKALKGPAKKVMTESTEAAEKAFKNLAEDVTKDSAVAGKLVEHAKQLSEEVKAIEGAKQTAAKEIVETAEKSGVAHSVKSAGHEIKVTRSGYIVRCSDPCTTLRGLYSETLEKRPDLLEELEGLEYSLKNNEDLALIGAKAAELEGTLRIVSGIADDVGDIIKGSRRLVSESIPEVVLKLQSKYPILKEFPLSDERLARILMHAPDVQKMKGQLLEELMSVKMHGIMASPQELERMGLKSLPGDDISFIEGHRIRSRGGRQLTDGMVVTRNGDVLEIQLVQEAKGGRAASEGLLHSSPSVRKMSVDQKKELFIVMEEELGQSGKMEAAIKRKFGKNSEELSLYRNGRELPDEAIAKIVEDGPLRKKAYLSLTEQGGQVRRDVERLSPTVGDYVDDVTDAALGPNDQKLSSILIDGVEVKVSISPTRTKFVGTLPSDVAGGGLTKGLTELGYSFSTDALGITQRELASLAKEIEALSKASP